MEYIFIKLNHKNFLLWLLDELNESTLSCTLIFINALQKSDKLIFVFSGIAWISDRQYLALDRISDDSILNFIFGHMPDTRPYTLSDTGYTVLDISGLKK